MSTRGWYDYYVIAPHTGTLSLAMRFYKWGDATPENALDEYLRFRKTLSAHDERLPVEWLDRLLRDQLGELHRGLPPYFATGAFLFLVQRAAEWIECDHWRRIDPPEERADFHLSWAIEEALAAEPFEIPPHPDPLLERVRRFIATARYLRPWRNYGLRLNLLGWLQYLTQPTRSADMGSLAGDWDTHWHIAYRYRLFFWIHPDDPFRIARIAIELCDRAGSNLLTAADPEDDDEWRREELNRLRETIRESDIAMAALETVQREYAMPADRFWKFRERPDPHEARPRAPQDVAGKLQHAVDSVRETRRSGNRRRQPTAHGADRRIRSAADARRRGNRQPRQRDLAGRVGGIGAGTFGTDHGIRQAPPDSGSTGIAERSYRCPDRLRSAL